MVDDGSKSKQRPASNATRRARNIFTAAAKATLLLYLIFLLLTVNKRLASWHLRWRTDVSIQSGLTIDRESAIWGWVFGHDIYHPPHSISFYSEAISDADIRAIRQFGSLGEISLHETGITPAQLGRLANLKNLRHVFMSGSEVNDEHVRVMAQFTRDLRLISFSDCPVTKNAVKDLAAGFPRKTRILYPSWPGSVTVTELDAR